MINHTSCVFRLSERQPILSTMAEQARRAIPASSEIYGLAEGPVWDAARERVLWVDINAGAVHTGILRDGRIEARGRFTIAGTAGAVVCSAAGELLVAGTRGLHTVAADGTVTAGARLIPEAVASRLNDGKCDPAGRFLVGSMALDDRRGEDVLLSIGRTGSITVLDEDLTLSNGLGWSPDGTVLYSTDTVPGVIWSRAYRPDSGTVGPRRELLRITDGSPDGLCVDADGNLWIAIWGAGEVRRYSPTGTRLATVAVPAPNTTSVAFVGPGLDTLLITTASEQLSTRQLAEFPDSGRLFTCAVDAVGLPVAPWSAP
jgi:sugar lactone lactonase YvrE